MLRGTAVSQECHQSSEWFHLVILEIGVDSASRVLCLPPPETPDTRGEKRRGEKRRGEERKGEKRLFLSGQTQREHECCAKRGGGGGGGGWEGEEGGGVGGGGGGWFGCVLNVPILTVPPGHIGDKHQISLTKGGGAKAPELARLRGH
ncbi:hypothetical protein EYF80_008500 [Liparis tanakae]|uniref:Uncharacterized protein n=1 Tax=Liparis tanakae TaxID=230148 RepID=A0A4Z2ITJ0_9TELE|nr:hypothetical protein EYF80_008500 [Liparis tanakae]